MEKNQNDNLIGMELAQRFKIIRLIGQGGMANVYLATDMQNQARVAVKILKPELLDDEELVHRFDIEAKAASSLSHPNIVKVYGVGEENEIRYMVMQYVEGMTLKEMIDRYGKLDWRVAVPICLQVVAALQNAHAHGIVHRDIKPHNIMITRDHRALVTDFGIARASTANTITLSGGSAMGSVHYFSPEQARGGIVGAKSDLYSLGIMMYEMVTGQLPFDGDTNVAVAIMHLQNEAVPPIKLNPSLPLGLSNIIMKCMRKLPTERYESAEELGQELARFQQNPGETYGIVHPDPKQAEKTTVMPSSYTNGNAFNKVRNLERSIYERRKKRRRESIIVAMVSLLCITLIIAFFVYALSGLANNLKTGSSEERGTPLGNYVNRRFDEVSDELNRLKVPYSTKQEYSDTKPEGVIIAQNLPEGKLIKQITLNTLQLTVSKGTSEFALEDYAGRSVIEVENYLRGERKLNVQIESIADDKVPQDHIIKTDPGPNAKVKPGYTVKLYVSSGQKLITVPKLSGLKLKDAEALLEKEGLSLGDIKGYDESDDADDYVVVGQDPAPSVDVAKGTPVTLEAAKARARETESDDSHSGGSSNDFFNRIPEP